MSNLKIEYEANETAFVLYYETDEEFIEIDVFDHKIIALERLKNAKEIEHKIKIEKGSFEDFSKAYSTKFNTEEKLKNRAKTKDKIARRNEKINRRIERRRNGHKRPTIRLGSGRNFI